MTVLTEVTVEDLNDLDLDKTPPCDVIFYNHTTKHKFQCGKPSVVRVRSSCQVCGRSNAIFLCARCWADAQKGTLTCYYCFDAGRPNSPTYRET